ncbi:MAG: hypothetical protein JNM91_00845 [Flavobacteriales bacterium]|nr:hypothetical protein [Flavobacteriales bacterium]
MVQIEAIGNVTINPSNEMMPGKKGGPSVLSAVREKTVSTKEAYQNIVHSAEKEPRIQAKTWRFIEGESELIAGDREATGGRGRGGGAVFHRASCSPSVDEFQFLVAHVECLAQIQFLLVLELDAQSDFTPGVNELNRVHDHVR